MDEVIENAINSIDQILFSPLKQFSKYTKPELINFCNLLNRLLQSDSPKNDWTRWFYRRLKRLMNHDESLSIDSWIELHDDIVYVLEGPNGKQGIDIRWNYFLRKMKLEEKLEQRELEFQRTFGERKSWHQLFSEHRKFFEEYLPKCISLHSKVQVRGLVEDLDDFICNSCGLTKTSLVGKNEKCLKEKLECIEIPLDCSKRSMSDINNEVFAGRNLHRRVNNSLSSFLPSNEPRFDHCGHSETVEQVLQCKRWLVVLGDPGSAKTSLLRWITRVSAEAAHRGDEEVAKEVVDHSAVRIPILIRFGEFASWLNQNQNKTLIDYIDKHTWFSQPYTHDNDGTVLRELIYHGHALILLDGLDEISDVGRRGEIVELIRKFIYEYVRTPDFFSAFDDTMFQDDLLSFIEARNEIYSRKHSGNQIIITSRIVGYQLYPIVGPFIRHYSLLLINHTEAKKFVDKWMIQVDKGLLDVLLNEGIKLDGEMMKTLSKKRYNAVQSMFENGSELLMSNPSLLSLICTSVFQSPDVFRPKSRIEVYDHAVQSALRSWTTTEPRISKDLLTNFLINLSTYLHLESPSGLIDTYDMKQLCCLTLRQQSVSNNRTKLREYANRMIFAVESNTGIIAEIGLQVFSFLHLSFPEYFVSQSFLKGSSVDAMAKRILTFLINPRFRESLLLTLGWISWKWSSQDYDKLCNLLVTPNKNYVIPVGALLLFDALNDLQILPSNAVIYTALNSLLDNPSAVIKNYLISNLSKLHEDIIIEWMQLYLKDEKHLSKFCQCLLMECDRSDSTRQIDSKSISRVICQQLWSFHNISTSVEFIIDRTLRGIMMSENAPDDIFNKNLSLSLQSYNIDGFNVHPLILSVIIAVCGGIGFKMEGNILTLHFSPRQMHRESSIIPPIIEYFDNVTDSHSIKVEPLIKQNESTIQKASYSDTSIDIIDTFIALICLKGLSNPLIYSKYDGYQALPLALDRLKRTWFFLKCPFDDIRRINDGPEQTLFASKVESIINMSFSQIDQSELVHPSAWASVLGKLRIKWSSDFFTSKLFHTRSASQNQPEFRHYDNARKLNEMRENIYPMQMFQHEQYFLLLFIPQSLQKLYYCTTIAPTNDTDSLPLVVLLSQCLIHLEDVSNYDVNFYLALSMLQPQLKEHMLENYASVLFWENNSQSESKEKKREEFIKAMKDCILLDQLFIDQSKDWEMLINMERQRIFEAKDMIQNQQKDLRLFAASISLARLFQARYRSCDNRSITHASLFLAESQEVHFSVINILDPILRIIALNIILDMKDPLIFDEEQRDQLRWEMIILLHSLLSHLPLLTATLLFVRCHTVRQVLSLPFQCMAGAIGKKLNEAPIDTENQDQKAAFIALLQLNDSNLSHYLSEFTKRSTINLSDIHQFHSSIFFRYFTNTTSFDKSNTILLLIMYLTELAFDSQILQMYHSGAHMTKISLLEELRQLWNDSSINEKIMTYKVASWITNHLKILNRAEMHQITKDVCRSSMIERKALPVIEKWLNYRMDKDLRFFAHYAALQLITEGSNIPGLIDIVTGMFGINTKFRLRFIVSRLFSSQVVDLITLRQILVSLHRHVRYSSNIFAWIDRKEILELILNLDFERVISNVHGSPEISTKPYLLMVYGCSHDLQLYLVDHLQTFINEQSEIKNTSKEEYLAVVIKWIIESWIWNDKRENFSQKLYEYIFTLLHDQRFPQVQKAVLNGLNSAFICDHRTSEGHIFLQNDTIRHLEKMINFCIRYPKDVVAVCLLAYGNCLRKLQKYQLSHEIQHSLVNLSEPSSLPSIISIRAAVCLIFTEQSFVTFSTVTNWFRHKWNLTPENKYNLLLQQTLYKWHTQSLDEDIYEVIDHIETHSTELLDRFMSELYDYLCNDYNNNYLFAPIPNYVKIAHEFSKKNINVFHNAAQKSSFGEKKFKMALYLCRTKKSQDCEAIVELYANFGVLTVELIEMLEWLDNTLDNRISHSSEGTQQLLDLKVIKQVVDREVIEKLLDQINLIAYYTKFNVFSIALRLLVHLAQSHVVSLLEVHERVSLIVKDFSYDDNLPDWYREDNMYHTLLHLTCIKQMPLPGNLGKPFTGSYMVKEFEEKIKDLENESSLSLRRTYFLTIFRPDASSFN